MIKLFFIFLYFIIGLYNYIFTGEINKHIIIMMFISLLFRDDNNDNDYNND